MEENSIIKKHSRLGMVSMIIGIVLPMLVAGLLITNTVIFPKHRNHTSFLESVMFWVWMIAVPLHLLGLIIAIVGICSKKTKKGFPVAGIVLNTVFGLIGIILIALGISLLVMAGGAVGH